MTNDEIAHYSEAGSWCDRLGRAGVVMFADLELAVAQIALFDASTVEAYRQATDSERLALDAQRAALAEAAYHIETEIVMEANRPTRTVEAQELAAALMEQDPAARQAGRDIAEARYAAWESGYRTRMAGG